jgi:hypothetical protein
MFGNLLGKASDGRNEGSKITLVNLGTTIIFDKEGAMSDFTNHLQSHVAATTITQGGPSDGRKTASSPPSQHLAGGGGNGGGPAPGKQDYWGIGLALLHLGHTMYNPTVIDTKLSVQLAVDPGDTTKYATFRDFVVNIQLFWVYLAMLGGQLYIPMIHSPGVYYSIKR